MTMCRHCRKCHRRLHSSIPIETIIPEEKALVIQQTMTALEKELCAIKEQVNLGISRCIKLADGTVVCFKGTHEWSVQGKFD